MQYADNLSSWLRFSDLCSFRFGSTWFFAGGSELIVQLITLSWRNWIWSYLVFGCGFWELLGIPVTFVLIKIDNSHLYWDVLDDCRLQRLLSKTEKLISKKDTKKTDEISSDSEDQDIFVERIRIEKLELRF